MKKILTFVFIICCSLFVTAQNIPARPNPPKLVNDLANVLTPDQVQTLEQKLVAYDDSTSNQIAVITIRSTGDYDISDVALKILREWGVGNKEKNNGIVLLAAIDDRKVWIATGYGLEGAVPDITAKHIIDNEILPNFKGGNYYRGFDEATSAIIKAAAGEYKAASGYSNRNKSRGGSAIGFIVILIIIILAVIKNRGGGGGGMMSRRGYRGFNNVPPIWWLPLGGGGSSSGSGWGGGGGGGGFGGFGGGGGGGGGAGGSW